MKAATAAKRSEADTHRGHLCLTRTEVPDTHRGHLCLTHRGHLVTNGRHAQSGPRGIETVEHMFFVCLLSALPQLLYDGPPSMHILLEQQPQLAVARFAPKGCHGSVIDH